MKDASPHNPAAKDMAVLLENLAVFSGLLAYAHSASKSMDHRLADLNKNLGTLVKELLKLVKELGNEEFAQEVDGLVFFLMGSHIEKTHVSWKEHEGVGVVSIHGVSHEHLAFSVSLRFGEKERLDAKDRSRGVTKGWGQTETEAEALAAGEKPKPKKAIKPFWTLKGMECATRRQEGRPPA